MSNKFMETGSSVGGNRCSVEEIVAIPGLNLIIAPDRQYESCSALNLSLAIAGATGFLERKPGHGRTLVFSLENAKEKTEQMLAQYNAMLGDITVVYAHRKGTFGNKIEDGLDVFLRDNPQLKCIVIDSIEKIVEGEVGKIKYDFAYNKLCALKEVASKHGATLLVATYTGGSEDSDKFTDVADTVLEVIKSSSQGGEGHTLFISGKNRCETKVTVGFDSGRYRWNQITFK